MASPSYRVLVSCVERATAAEDSGKMNCRPIFIASLVSMLVACGGEEPPTTESQVADDVMPPSAAAESPTGKTLYWGDTHLHTSYSPDAFLMQNQTADPDTAYRWAKGLPVVHPLHRSRIQIGTPLDFLVVSDHGEFMGVIPRLLQGDPDLAETPSGKKFLELTAAGRGDEAFADLIRQVNEAKPSPDFHNEGINRSVWGEIMDAAERHNDPGTFTAFLGWEWSSTPGGANLHRVIMMRDGKAVGDQFIPYTSFDSPDPEDLWQWLARTAETTGGEFLAIPHNSNISNGLMFPLADSDGNPIDADYAAARMRWERVAEITQIKGDSETHPQLAPTDEFADYETYEHLIAVGDFAAEAAVNPADYVRSALSAGVGLATTIGANPYQFGLIGSTDSHSGMASAEENNFHGKFALDSTPENLRRPIIGKATGSEMSAAGLVAVWAAENTREALFEAFSRREVYATTGPRIRVQFSATQGDNQVTMGGELNGAGAPTFVVSALKDPKDANLDRIQIIKGWSNAAGETREQIFDVALSDGRTVGGDGKVPAVGNTVDTTTGMYENSIGSAELSAEWTDPAFDDSVNAYYYARVLQIPTPRHTLYGAIALGIDPAELKEPATLQERAYTSPIWYTP